MLGSFNNCNSITLSHKDTTIEAFEEVQRVVLDGINENMASLVQPGKYGTMNMTDTTTMGYYVIKFVFIVHTIQEDTICDVKISADGELVVK